MSETKAQQARFAECRRRVGEGCGGTHVRGPQVADSWFWYWKCCRDCPDRAELNPSWAGEDVFPRQIIRRPTA